LEEVEDDSKALSGVRGERDSGDEEGVPVALALAGDVASSSSSSWSVGPSGLIPAGAVTVVTLFPSSFGVPVGFQPIFFLVHYTYPFLNSHATYMDDTFYSRE
jgi:hypothetical protein